MLTVVFFTAAFLDVMPHSLCDIPKDGCEGDYVNGGLFAVAKDKEAEMGY